jgi:hypothetical protein
MQPDDIERIGRQIEGAARAKPPEDKEAFGFRMAPVEVNGKATGSHVEGKPEAKNTAVASAPLPADVERVIKLFFEDHLSIADIVEAVYGVSAAGGGRRYTKLRDEVEAFLRLAGQVRPGSAT